MKKGRRSYEDLFKIAIKCLIDNNIDFVIVGGAIVPYYGISRSTQDIDIMIMFDDSQKDRIAKVIECFNKNEISITLDELLQSFSEGIHVSAFDTTNYAYRLDLKKINTELDQLTFTNRKVVDILDHKVPISSPESLIAVKSSEGFRSTSDVEDILGIIEETKLEINILLNFLEITNSKNYFCNLLINFPSDNAKLLSKQLC